MIIEESNTTVKYSRPTRIDWIVAVGLFIASLILYGLTTAPDVLPGDPGEFQFAAWRLGLPHPTGYPFYMLLGSAWQHALAIVGVSPALALNLMSSLFASLAVAAMYVFMLQAPSRGKNTRRMVAVFSALLLASNSVLWSQAVLAEVYALQALFILTLLILLQRISFMCAGSALSTRCKRTLIASVFLFGLGLTHHATTLLLLPAIVVYLWRIQFPWRQFTWRGWTIAIITLLLPLTLYAYIPLRSNASASPWLHQPFGGGALSLYQNDVSHFISYITGRSISVGFNDTAAALQRLPEALRLWHNSFGVVGLLLMALGVYVLVLRNRPLLWLTVVTLVAQQLFNLFYAIGDIAAYYIPLFIIGAIWAGYGAAGLADGVYMRWLSGNARVRSTTSMGTRVVLLLCLLPIWQIWAEYSSLDQSGNESARAMWEEILAATPDGQSILISNDRDEIPPLMYMQYVEGRALSATAMHPLMAPDARFSDIGATVDTALRDGGGAPVFLIKHMPGLEVKYILDESAPPLVGVQPRRSSVPMVAVEQPIGGLTLVGYDWIAQPDDAHSVLVRFYWRVDERLDADYTTSVQIFSDNDQKLAQNDAQPGGVYYPTSLWKPGETLVDEHVLSLPEDGLSDELTDAAILQIGAYTGPDFRQLGEPLRLHLDDAEN